MIMMMKSSIPSVYIGKTLVACVSALCSNTARYLIDDSVVRGADFDDEDDNGD